VSQKSGILYLLPQITPAHHTVNTVAPRRKSTEERIEPLRSQFTNVTSESRRPIAANRITVLTPVRCARIPANMVKAMHAIAITDCEVHHTCRGAARAIQ